MADVVAAVVERMKAGASLQEASSLALRQYKKLLKDADEGPLVWLALAHVQWKYGIVEAQVLEQIRKDISAERGLDRWREDPADLVKRKRVLATFFDKMSRANPKPASPPRSLVRLAPFNQGDCLCVLTPGGAYTAAIVLKMDNSKAEYGSNLIGSLDYLAPNPPQQRDFEERRWLFKHHGNWNGAQELSWYLPVGLRQARKRIAVVGSTAIRSSDPRSSDSYAAWFHLGEQILLARAQL